MPESINLVPILVNCLKSLRGIEAWITPNERHLTRPIYEGFEDWLNEGGYKLESLESDEIDLNELKLELNMAYARYISPEVGMKKLPDSLKPSLHQHTFYIV
jgi:hypothetical protein